ncbi:MAG: hypothetical protein IAX21_11325 [Candidatus Bathyarchaeota archaeon]|nr:MAG: hypothetical protein IAX21_11325 [Candidatus Bathyarchaeota archaeon]
MKFGRKTDKDYLQRHNKTIQPTNTTRYPKNRSKKRNKILQELNLQKNSAYACKNCNYTFPHKNRKNLGLQQPKRHKTLPLFKLRKNHPTRTLNWQKHQTGTNVPIIYM